MTLSAQAAAMAELRAENDRMRALLAEILAADQASIDSLTRMGYAPRPELFPFVARIRAMLPVVHSGVREFVKSQ
jgi:hypothetical protein